MTQLREATRREGAGRSKRLAPPCMLRSCDTAAIAGDVLCTDHDRRYRRSCPFCGKSMKDAAIARGACGRCLQRTWVREALQKAQRAAIDAGVAPREWAGFALTGYADLRSLAPRGFAGVGRTMRMAALGLSVLLAVLLVALAARRSKRQT